VAGSSGGSRHYPDQDRYRAIMPEEVPWRSFEAFPKGAELAVLVGDPFADGPYLIRVRVAHGVRLMPHRHPEDRVYTVISGIFYIGLGDVFDASLLTAYAPGAVVVLPGGQSHFHCALRGEYVSQVAGIGPLGLDYVDASDDPRRIG